MPPLSTSHVFISYSRRDTEVMQRIVSFLRGQGLKAWVDNEKLVPGTPIWEREIEKAIDAAYAVVVVLSPDAKESVWVLNELTLADEYKKRVFPVLVRGDFRESIHFRLVTRQFVDLRTNEEKGLESLSAALSRYLEELKQLEEERLTTERETERLKQEEAKRLAAQKAEDERVLKAKQEKERPAKEKRRADEAEKEQQANVEVQHLVDDKDRSTKAKPEVKRPALYKARTYKQPKEAPVNPASLENGSDAQVASTIRQKLLSRPGLSIGIAGGSIIIAAILGYVVFTSFRPTPAPMPSPTVAIIQSPLATDIVQPTETTVAASPGGLIITPDTVSDLVELHTLDVSEQFMIAVSKDFNLVVMQPFSNGPSVSLWDLSTGKQLATLTTPANIWAAAISPNNDVIATGSTDNNIYIWNIQGELINTFSGHVNDVSSVAFSPKGDLLASGSYDTTIKLWDVKSGNLLRTFNGHTGSVTILDFSPDGQSIISGSNDHSVRLWTTEELTSEKIFLTGGSNAIPAFWSSKNGDTLITVDNVSGSDIARLWEISTGVKIAEYRGFNFALSPDGDRIAFVAIDESKNTQVGDKTTIGRESTIRVEKIGGEETIVLAGCVGSNVNDMVFSPDGRLIVTNDYGSGLCLRDSTNGTVVKEIKLSSFSSSLMFNADGTALLAWGGGIVSELGLKP